MDKLKVLFDRVLVKMQDSTKQTQSGITLPDTNEYKIKKGIVVDVGQGAPSEGCQKCGEDLNASQELFSIGDKVIFEEFCATYIEIDGEKYAILKQIDILAKEIN